MCLNCGFKVTQGPGTPSPVAEPAEEGVPVHWVVRREAGTSEFFVQTRKLPGEETTSIKAGGKVLGLSACSTCGAQYVAWSAYDGQQFWLVLGRINEDPLAAAAVVRRGVLHPVGSVAFASIPDSVIFAWESRFAMG